MCTFAGTATSVAQNIRFDYTPDVMAKYYHFPAAAFSFPFYDAIGIDIVSKPKSILDNSVICCGDVPISIIFLYILTSEEDFRWCSGVPKAEGG